MKLLPALSLALALSLSGSTAFGRASSRVGPDSAHRHPTVAQADWPKGIVALPRHESRVYSVWVNGNENFYFKADPKEINELIKLFSQARMRDHDVIIKKGNPEATSFKKEKYAYNVNLHVLAGIALGYVRGRDLQAAKTHEPQLIIHFTEQEAKEWLPKLVIPRNIILTSEFKGLKSPHQRPKRNTWFAELQFDNGKPAVDFSRNVQTRVTLWTHGSNQGIHLGSVSRQGGFQAPFSDEELTQLAAGEAWLTVTTGNWSTPAQPDHPRLKVTDLYLDRKEVKPMTINPPGLFHGRLLFEDGKPAFLQTKPWPGAQIKISFPDARPVAPDTNGDFQIYFTPNQLQELKNRRPRPNVFVPLAEKWRSRALHVFPVEKLAPNKAKAGVVKIPQPSY